MSHVQPTAHSYQGPSVLCDVESVATEFMVSTEQCEVGLLPRTFSVSVWVMVLCDAISE
jgi:hypothetical protein